MTLTPEESALLKELVKSEQTITGNKPRDDLKRLIQAGYVVEESGGNISMTFYKITDAGRAALKTAH